MDSESVALIVVHQDGSQETFHEGQFIAIVLPDKPMPLQVLEIGIRASMKVNSQLKLEAISNAMTTILQGLVKTFKAGGGQARFSKN